MTSTPNRDRASVPDTQPSDSWQIKLLYDGDCPLCLREVNFLKTRRWSGIGQVCRYRG